MKDAVRCKPWPSALVAMVVLFWAGAAGAEPSVKCPPQPVPESALESVPESATSTSAPAYTKEGIREMIVRAAEKDGRVPASLALAVARVESNFNPDAESSAGARGVMQIMPATARNEYGVDPIRLWDAGTNIELGVRFLGDLYERYGRDWEAALSHYNGGVLTDGAAHTFTAGYVASVQRWWRTYDPAAPLDRRARSGVLVSVDDDRGARRLSRGSEYQMTQEDLDAHIKAARARVRAALVAQGAYD